MSFAQTWINYFPRPNPMCLSKIGMYQILNGLRRLNYSSLIIHCHFFNDGLSTYDD